MLKKIRTGLVTLAAGGLLSLAIYGGWALVSEPAGSSAAAGMMQSMMPSGQNMMPQAAAPTDVAPDQSLTSTDPIDDMADLCARYMSQVPGMPSMTAQQMKDMMRGMLSGQGQGMMQMMQQMMR